MQIELTNSIKLFSIKITVKAFLWTIEILYLRDQIQVLSIYIIVLKKKN